MVKYPAPYLTCGPTTRGHETRDAMELGPRITIVPTLPAFRHIHSLQPVPADHIYLGGQYQSQQTIATSTDHTFLGGRAATPPKLPSKVNESSEKDF